MNLNKNCKQGYCIGSEIHSLDNLLKRRLISYQMKQGVEEAFLQYGWVIIFLYENRGREVFQKDLETEYGIPRSTVTGIVKLMEQHGYIMRKSVEHDNRLKKIVLTEKGIRSCENTMKDIDFLEKGIQTGISELEIENFLNVIHKMKKNIEHQIY